MRINRTTDFELLARLNKPVHELHVSLYPEHFTEYNFEAIRDLFKQWITKENFVFFLMEDNEQPLGYAWIELKSYPPNALSKERKSVFVHQIGIVEERNRKGYGSQLMNYIYDFAKSHGMDLVELDYWVNNEQAKNFYNKQGFRGYREFVYKKL